MLKTLLLEFIEKKKLKHESKKKKKDQFYVQWKDQANSTVSYS